MAGVGPRELLEVIIRSRRTRGRERMSERKRATARVRGGVLLFYKERKGRKAVMRKKECGLCGDVAAGGEKERMREGRVENNEGEAEGKREAGDSRRPSAVNGFGSGGSLRRASASSFPLLPIADPPCR